MKKIVLTMALIFLSVSMVLTGILLYDQRKIGAFMGQAGEIRAYDHHYLFVSSDQSQMIQDIFRAAKESAAETDGYLEWCPSGVNHSFTEAQCIDLSVALGADGIIVCPDGTEGLAEAIDRADEAGVPVVTILRDLPGSSRVSYAGVSSYQTGDLYGGRLLSLLHEGLNDVCLLEDKDAGKGESQILYNQMVQAVLGGAPSGKTMQLRTAQVDPFTDFDTEEVIRNLLLGKKVPDILICESSLQTECAIQAMIDYNLVGRVKVIGYYATESILHALRQELIPVTMTIDTAQLGSDCTQALDEYRHLRRVSEYYPIALATVTPKTLDAYLAKQGTWKEGEGEEDLGA